MYQAAQAYAKVAQVAQTPRQLEAGLLIKAASRLQALGDDWTNRRNELEEALTYNRKIWTVLVTSATAADHPLPHAIKQNIANLGLFIFNHTMAVLSDPKVEKLGVLININREIAAGLRASPQAA